MLTSLFHSPHGGLLTGPVEKEFPLADRSVAFRPRFSERAAPSRG